MRRTALPRPPAGAISPYARLAACTGLLLYSAIAIPATADILTLANGGTLEGDVLEVSQEGYKVRTVVGTVTVPADFVVSIESTTTAFQRYERKKASAPETPEGQFELAVWCQEHNLHALWRLHLGKAIQLDGDYTPAREALGYVRVGDNWIDGRQKSDTAKKASEQDDDADEKGEDRNDEKIVKAIQTTWYRRIRAIKRTYLDSALRRLVKEGYERIREIRDPLAILPMSKVLGNGSRANRSLLIEMLKRFREDEATMNLAVLALLDPDDTIRREALSEVVQRDDERIPAQFRTALNSGNELLIRRAAVGLGLMKRREVIPELIELLKVQQRQLKEVPVSSYVGQLATTFNGATSVQVGTQSTITHVPQLGVMDAGFILSGRTELRWKDVTVFRTEVLEALKAITGRNFGFEMDDWRRWYEENRQ
jgi:hypothetical protein